MFLSSQASFRELANCSRRLATALESGIEIRRAFERESQARGSSRLRSRMRTIHEAIARGDTLQEAFRDTGTFFPGVFRDLVAVGEETGKLPAVFKNLAEHYEHRLQVQRTFRSTIAWPIIQLTMAVGIIGLLILVMGYMPKQEGKNAPFDMLGLGLYGVTGLMVYLFWVGFIAVGVIFIIVAMKRGVAWTSPIQQILLALPILGPTLQTLSLARMTWTMHLTMDTSMSILSAIPLCLRSTQNARYTRHIEDVRLALRHGGELAPALAQTRAFPHDFIESLEVGEQSGRLPESMAILSTQYQDKANRAMATLAMLAGYTVWVGVAVIIIFMIFRMALSYIGMIDDAVKGNF